MNEPKENCKYCHGTGIVTDLVPYGSTNVPMDTDCDCIYEDDVECPTCQGWGEIKERVSGKSLYINCPNCDGDGFISQEKYNEIVPPVKENVYEKHADLWNSQ